MKRFVCCCITLLYILGLCSAIAEEYSMWKGIQFGDSLEEIEEKCAGVGDGGEYMHREKDSNYTGEPEHYVLHNAGVAGVEDVTCLFYFNDAGQLSDISFEVLDRTIISPSDELVGIVPTPYDLDAVQASYKKVSDGLISKYGQPIDVNDIINEKFTGIVFEYFINKGLNFTTTETHIREYTTNALYGNFWLIPLDNGGAVKIEIIYEEYQKSCKNKNKNLDALGLGTWDEEGVEFRWGYSYIEPEDMEEFYHNVGSINNDL